LPLRLFGGEYARLRKYPGVARGRSSSIADPTNYQTCTPAPCSRRSHHRLNGEMFARKAIEDAFVAIGGSNESGGGSVKAD
jgi:hypothetical protein